MPKCHGPTKQEGGLRVDSRQSLLNGGGSGPAISPGEIDNSLLISAIRRTGDFEMPPDKPLSEAQVAAISTWVQQGALWPGKSVAISSATSPEAFAKARREHWSLQPVRAPQVPVVKDSSWPLNLVDQFILARLEAAGLRPSPRADKAKLLRRVTLDLIGLPPTFAQVQAFEADESPDAYAKVVDRLLASPRYGERWGRHWLDVARYSDTKGYVFFEEGSFRGPGRIETM
jgi:hypothetical protein